MLQTTTRHKPLKAVHSTLSVAILLLVFAQTLVPTTALRYMGLSIAHHQHVFDGWEAKTGKKIDVTFKPLTHIIAEAQQDMKQNLNFFDVYQIHPAMTSFAEKKWIRELTNDVKDPKFKWTDIALSVRKWQSEYNGGAWSVPIDTDTYLMYYRRDLISSPPATWEEYIEVAKKWHGKDINGDGIPDFGTCTITEGQFNKLAYTIAATVMKYKKGSRQGFVYDVSDRDDELMANLLETEGWAYTMELLKEIWKYGQGTEVFISEAFKQFREGRCATYISFGSAGTQTVAAGTYMKGKLGVARAPGSSKVYDRVTKSLVPCDDERCSFIEPGNLNRPSFNTGGVQLIINGQLKGEALEDALDFCAYVTNNVDVRLAGAINPFRDSHFNATWYTEAAVPWDLTDAEMYTSAVRDGVEFPHTLAAPPLATYPILNANVDRAIKEYVRLGQYNTSTDDLPTIMKNCVKRLNEESLAEGFTPEILEAHLREASGLPPYAPPVAETKEFPYWVISIILVFVALGATGAYMYLHKAMKTANAPKNPDQPFAALFIGPKNISELWQRFPDKVPEAQAIYKDRVRKAIRSNKCYEARQIGDYFLLVSPDPARLLNAAAEIRDLLDRVIWTEVFSHVDQGNTSRSRSKHAARRIHEKHSVQSDQVSRSSKHSHGHSSMKSGASGQSGSTAWGDTMCLKLAAGFAYGSGRIVYDEELNHYDYSGAVIEDAAHVADVAQPNQMLVTETVVNVVDENDSDVRGNFAAFCQKKLKGSGATEDLQQFNTSKSMPKTFAVPSDDGEVVDSVMQALEQAAGGLSQKRITVLHVRVNDFPCDSSLSRDAVTRKYKELYEMVVDEVIANRGHIHQSQEGEFVITFNAAHPTAGHAFRAGICAMGIITTLRENDYDEVQCGFDSGLAWVGRMPSAGDEPPHYVIMGNVATCARAFANKCSDYPADENVRCLTSSRFRDDLSTSLFFQYVDVIPGTASASGSTRPLGLLSVVARKQTDEDDCDEWIYELQNHDVSDPFAHINKCFEAVLLGDMERAHEMLGDSESLNDHPSNTVERIRAIAGAGSVDAYVKPAVKK